MVEIKAATLKAILAAKKAKHRVIAVGTTSCRSLNQLIGAIKNSQQIVTIILD